MKIYEVWEVNKVKGENAWITDGHDNSRNGKSKCRKRMKKHIHISQHGNQDPRF